MNIHPVLDHWRQKHDRNCEDQNNPEAFFKISDHHRMMVMTLMSHWGVVITARRRDRHVHFVMRMYFLFWRRLLLMVLMYIGMFHFDPL
jgi:hypothetical protein